MNRKELCVSQARKISLENEISVNRLGYGAMRLTGEGIWGPPKDRKTASAVLRRAVELGIDFIDTAYAHTSGKSWNLEACCRTMHDLWIS
jgi:aryl-alcohol dehydrogenase-like predicted oxidoreductase